MSLNAWKRHEEIMELLLKQGDVKVAVLSDLLGVAGKTIREDLMKLEQQGLLVRIHGGAVLPSGGHVGVFPDRISQMNRIAEKQEIAGKALALIEPEDIIALDGGSTTLEIARALPNASYTVITNDVFIISELVKKDQIRLIVPGGYRKRNLLVSGEAVPFLRKLNIQKAFISTTGIHAEYGLSIYTTELVEQKQALLENAKYCYCVADHTKFDKYALLTFAGLSELDRLITDSQLPDAIRQRYSAAGVFLD